MSCHVLLNFLDVHITKFLISANNRRFYKDCKVILSEPLITYHGLLVVAVEIKIVKKKKRSLGDFKVKWGNLTNENASLLA